MKEKLIAEIIELSKKCEDVALLGLIKKLLEKSL